MTTDVLILGGGIGGLAAAHDLRQRGFQGSIRIIERNNKVGGQARSDYVPGTQLPTEYSWRVYGPHYTTLRRILKQIPYKNEKTVYDNLIEVPNVLVPQNSGKYFQFQTNASSVLLKYVVEATDHNPCVQKQLLEKFLYLMTSSPERLHEELDNVTWEEYFGELSGHARDYIVLSNAAIFGGDVYKCSVLSVLETLPSSKKRTSENNAVMNGPTSERFLEPWRKYLESLNVEVLVNARVTEIALSDANTIDHITFETADGNPTQLRAKTYVFDLPIEVMADLTIKSYTQLGQSVPKSISHWSNLSQESHQQIVGLQLYFDQVITYPDTKQVILMVESPWQLVILPTVMWKDINMRERDPEHKIVDSWTLALNDQKTLGWKIQKPWPECTREEIQEEVWAQISGTAGMVKYIPDIAHVKPVKMYLWHSYQPNASGIMETWEPKFSSNAGTWQQRPDIFVPCWKNAYLATAYVKGSVELIRMDAAAEAGVRVAEQIITNQNHLMRPNVLAHRALPLLLGPLWLLDRKRVQCSKPHVAKSYFGGSSLMMCIAYILVIIIVLILIGIIVWQIIVRVDGWKWVCARFARVC